MKERKAMPKFGAPARRRLLFGWPHGTVGAALFAALAFLGWQTPTAASSRGLQIAAGPQSWRSAQASDGGAAAPKDDDKSKGDKTSVPATVVDGAQLESVLGIQAVSATGEDMGRIVDIIVDRSGQVRAAIIDFGGFLGVGSRKIAVDWRSLHFDPKKAGVVVVNLTKDQLRVAPVYKADEPAVVIGGPSAKP